MDIETKTKECLGKCPYCGSENVNYEPCEILDDTVRYPADCEDCGKQFNEDYAIEYAETQYTIEVE